MGNCLGRCLSSGQNSLRRSTDEQESDELVPEDEISGDKYIFKIMKFKKKKRPQFIDQFLERQDKNYARLNEPGNKGPVIESSEIQLQCLDAQNLLVTTTSIHHQDHIQPSPITKFDNYQSQQIIIGQQIGVASSSRASSSLDLEWEHEYASANLASSINNQNTMQHNQKQSWHFLSNELLSSSSQQIVNSNYDDINNYDNSDKQQQQQFFNFYSINNLNIDGSQNNIMIPPKHPGIVQLQQQINNNYNNNNNNNVNQKMIFVRTPSRTSWSHISTPESLEWDIDEDQQKELHVEDDNLDHETLELLHDIELLKNKVLNETGDGLEIQYKNS